MVMDAFKVHFTDEVAAATLIGHTVFVKVPTACTSKGQSIDVRISKPLKSMLG